MRTDDHPDLDVVTLVCAEYRRERVHGPDVSGQRRGEVGLGAQPGDGANDLRPVREGKITRLSGRLFERAAASIEDPQPQRLVAVVDHERAVVGARDRLRAWQRHTASALLRAGPQEWQADRLGTGRNDGLGRDRKSVV